MKTELETKTTYSQSMPVKGTVLKNALNGLWITRICISIEIKIAPQSFMFVNNPILNSELNSDLQFKALNI